MHYKHFNMTADSLKTYKKKDGCFPVFFAKLFIAFVIKNRAYKNSIVLKRYL